MNTYDTNLETKGRGSYLLIFFLLVALFVVWNGTVREDVIFGVGVQIILSSLCTGVFHWRQWPAAAVMGDVISGMLVGKLLTITAAGSAARELYN